MRVSGYHSGAQFIKTQEAATHLGLASTELYGELRSIILAAEAQARDYLVKVLTETIITAYMDTPRFAAGELHLPFGPVQSVTSIHRIDTDGTENLVPTSDYYVTGGVIVFNSLPSPERTTDGITVVYVSGDENSVPTSVRMGLLKLIATHFENREDTGPEKAHMMPHASMDLLDTWRTPYGAYWRGC